MSLDNQELSKWGLGIVAVPIVWAINGVLQLSGRTSKLEGQQEDVVNRLDRIESKLDRLIETKHGGR